MRHSPAPSTFTSNIARQSASLQWLTERADEPFGMDRFRPHLTVDAGDPWIEDTWRDFSVGAARLGPGLAWPRRTIPQVDQVDVHERGDRIIPAPA